MSPVWPMILLFIPEQMKATVFLLIALLALTAACRPSGVAEQQPVTAEMQQISIQDSAVREQPVTITPDEREQFLVRGYVRYSDFGATGDGRTDDIAAIVATHDFANKQGLPVKADEGATYYIGGKDLTAIIKTDTDFGESAFIVDDTNLENIRAQVFQVATSLEPFETEGILSLRRNQENIGISLPGPALIRVTDNTVMRYIRFGRNQNNGAPQTDIFIVDKDGNVDMNAPIIWDFDRITEISVLPIDETTLNITGGRFTTIANRADTAAPYHSRGISIRRSNVLIDGLRHDVTDEGEHGAPYGGFLTIGDCANVIVQNAVLTGRKRYDFIGSAGLPVARGSYGISIYRAINVSFINSSQTNDINDTTYWGIMGSNYSKNLVFDGVSFSRFDAHMGVANVTIRNSTLGHQGINAIGTGTLLVENSKVYGRNLVNLRQDYGSTWEGEFIIRNTVFVPNRGYSASASLIGGFNSGQHDFGYPTYMPRRITIENLHIDDSNHPDGYGGPAIFANFNPEMTSESHLQKFPYIITREVILHNVTTASGMPLRTSNNALMFRDVEIINQ